MGGDRHLRVSRLSEVEPADIDIRYISIVVMFRLRVAEVTSGVNQCLI